MEDGRVLLEGTKDKDSPIYQAMRKVYEECGGEKGKEMTRINWRSDKVLPDWNKEEGWHFKNFECLAPQEAGPIAIHQ